MHTSQDRDSQSDPARPYDRGRVGPVAHGKRPERVSCPACDGVTFCDYCAGAGKVSPADTNVIRRQMGAQESEPIG